MSELNIKVAKLETKVDTLVDDISEITTELKVVHGRITEGNEKVMEKLMSMSKESSNQHDGIVDRMNTMDKRINGRITVLEQWRWLVIGGAAVIGWIISNTGFVQKLFG